MCKRRLAGKTAVNIFWRPYCTSPACEHPDLGLFPSALLQPPKFEICSISGLFLAFSFPIVLGCMAMRCSASVVSSALPWRGPTSSRVGRCFVVHCSVFTQIGPLCDVRFCHWTVCLPRLSGRVWLVTKARYGSVLRFDGERLSQDLPTARSGVRLCLPPSHFRCLVPNRVGAEHTTRARARANTTSKASCLCKGHCVPSVKRSSATDLAHGLFYLSISPWFIRERRYGLDNLANRK